MPKFVPYLDANTFEEKQIARKRVLKAAASLRKAIGLHYRPPKLSYGAYTYDMYMIEELSKAKTESEFQEMLKKTHLEEAESCD